MIIFLCFLIPSGESIAERFRLPAQWSYSGIMQMEEKTFSFMTADDVKLWLFISLEKGWGTGTPIANPFIVLANKNKS